MDANVKPRRTYQSPRRKQQAEQTRSAIISAAGRVFRERGYGVPMPVIAREAGVAVETVYRTFGNKSALFKAVVNALLAGGIARGDTAIEDRPAIRAIIEEPDPRRQVALYAATQPGIHRRAGPLLRALRDAKSTDAALTRAWTELEQWRYDGQRKFVERLRSEGALKQDLSTDAAADVIWTLCSLAVYDLLVIDRGWSDDRYEEWLSSVLADRLLGG